jgi:hypothetical protein
VIDGVFEVTRYQEIKKFSGFDVPKELINAQGGNSCPYKRTNI